MNIASSGVATQIATQKTQFVQSQIKQNAQTEGQIADVISQAAENGAKAANSSGRGGNIDITV